MRRQHTTPNAYPEQLLDEHLRVLRRRSPDALGAAALHTRSVDARALLARAAGAASVDELLAAAHGRPGVHPDVSRMDPFALGELARVLACQDLHGDDRTDGLALLDLLLATFGPRRVAPPHQGLHCQLAFGLGHRQRSQELMNGYRDVPESVRSCLRVDLANPYVGGTGTPQRWLAAFGALLARPPVQLGTGDGAVFDRLESAGVQRVGAAQRITTIVTTYRPGPGLLTAVRSLVAQSWTNHEILVVDDGSPAHFDAVLRQAAALDPRVRLIRMPINGGTYVARNAGLGAATGVFVTFQDSDDFSHPCRLERQVEPLLAEPALFATTSVGMRVTESLVVTRPGWPQSRSYNLSSLMVRRRPALQHLGYLDVVRKGADAEYVERARAVFGRPAIRHLTGAPLALIRLSSTSLSSPDTGFGWMHPARHAYLSAFQAWHRGITQRATPARRPAHPAHRVFAAPRRLCGARDAASRYDVVLAGDWTTAGGGGPAAGRARTLAGRGLQVAVLHLDTFTNLTDGPQVLDAAVQDLVNDGTVDQVVLSDAVRADLLIVSSPEVLYFAPGTDSLVRADRVVVEIADDASPGSAQVCAPATRRLFGADPLFSPPGPHLRRLLAAAPDGPPLTGVDLPGTVDVAQWRLDRRGPRSDRPVLGRLCGGERAEWRRLREALPDSRSLDIRLLGDGPPGVPGKRPPRNWLVYRPGETSVRSFLFQVDFYVPVPGGTAPRDADPALLQALAAGCVVVLPQAYAPTFGDAAVYCAGDELGHVVQRLHAQPEEFLRQSRRGQDFVRLHHAHERYADRVAALLN